MFERAQQISTQSLLCYCNCDIILGQDFMRAMERTVAWSNRFLMVGRRWDTDITEPIDFAHGNWERSTRQLAIEKGFQRLYYNIDYFGFTRGIYKDIPALAIGRRWWDQWAVWKAAMEKAAVVDASDVVIAVHQNHDYSYHPQGMQGLWHSEDSERNFELAGGWGHLHTIEDATYRLTAAAIEPRRFYWMAPTRRAVRRVVKKVRDTARVRIWHPALEATRRVRHALGLRKPNVQVALRSRSAAMSSIARVSDARSGGCE